jgi:hypothetical protein
LLRPAACARALRNKLQCVRAPAAAAARRAGGIDTSLERGMQSEG